MSTINYRHLYNQHIIRNITLPLALLAAWFFAHPYTGIRHDSILYTAQALQNIYPEIYSGDLFFAYGSQENFTLFSKIYAFFIRLFGISNAAIILLLIGHAIWLLASFSIGKYLLGYPKNWFFLIILVAVPVYYGNREIFSYGELFLTARIFAEAFVLAGIAFLYYNHYGLCCLFIIAGLLMHPLIAIWGFLFVLFYSLWSRWRLFLTIIISGALILFLSALLGIGPASRLSERMSSSWYQITLKRNVYLYLENWRLIEFLLIAWFGCVLLQTLMLTNKPQLKRTFLISFLLGFIGIVLALIGGDRLHSVLIVQIQPWRSLWLIMYFGWIAWVALFFSLWRSENKDTLLLLAYLISFPLCNDYGGLTASLTFFVYLLSRKQLIGSSTRKVILIVIIGYEFILTSFQLYLIIYSFYFQFYFYFKFHSYTIRSALTIAAISAFFVLYKILARESQWLTLAALSSVSLLLFTGIIYWDERSEADKYIEGSSDYDHSAVFKHNIPKNATIYWQQIKDSEYLSYNSKMIWLLLGRKSYYSLHQGAGLIFSEKTAIEFVRRSDRLLKFGVEEAYYDFDRTGIKSYEFSKEQLQQGLLYICQDPMLDYVILNTTIPGYLECSFSDILNHEFCLYDCRQLLESATGQ